MPKNPTKAPEGLVVTVVKSATPTIHHPGHRRHSSCKASEQLSYPVIDQSPSPALELFALRSSRLIFCYFHPLLED